MDIMEQLLCPQVCLDIAETPLTIENPDTAPDIPPEADSSTLNDEVRVRMILDREFKFDQAQIPKKLSTSEAAVFKNIEYYNYLEKAKIHCTVCNKHIGTSAVAQFDRYIHPELNTLLCHACYKFYGSGEFEKDEDGSELYCKWCGQGGTVMCCSECPLVFCSPCVRRNLGNQAVAKIKSSDNWQCFKCCPDQLKTFHLTTHVLHAYSTQQIRAAIAQKNILMLKSDIALCCKATKRKRRVSSDDENDEFLPNKPKVKTVRRPEVPKLLPATPVMPTNALFQNLRLQAVSKTPGHDPLIKFVVKKKGVSPNVPTLASLMPNLINHITEASTSGSIDTINKSLRRTYAPTALGMQNNHRPKSQPISQQQGIRIAWLMNSISESRITVNQLLKEASTIQQKARTVNQYSELASLHNKMQHVIAQCAHALIETRKNMHKEFINYLQRMNVNHSSYTKNGNAERAPIKIGGVNIKFSTKNSVTKSAAVGKPITAEIDLCDDDDDDDVQENTKDPLTLSDAEDSSEALSLQNDVPTFVNTRGCTILEEVNLINSDEELEETPKANNRVSITITNKTVTTETEEESLDKNLIENNENEISTLDDASGSKMEIEETQSNPSELETEKKSPDEELESNNNSQSTIVSDSCATVTDDENNISEIITENAISKKLQTQFENIYNECISINKEVPYDSTEMSYEEFMRAITVQIVLNHKNPKTNVECDTTSLSEETKAQEIENSSKLDCKIDGKKKRSKQRRNSYSDNSESQNAEESFEQESNKSFDFVQQMQNENSLSSTTTGSIASTCLDKCPMEDVTQKQNTVTPTKVEENPKELVSETSQLDALAENTNINIPTFAGNVPSVSAISIPQNTEYVTNSLPSISPSVSSLVTTASAICSIPLPLINSPPMATNSNNLPLLSSGLSNISANASPAVTPSPLSVPDYPTPMFNTSLHLSQGYNNTMQTHPGHTFNNSSLPAREESFNTMNIQQRPTFNNPSLVPQESFNSPLQFPPAGYSRLPQPQIYNNPAQQQSPYNNNASPIHPPYNPPAHNYPHYNNPQIRPPFNNPHSPFNPATSHMHSTYNNPSTFNTNPGYNSPSLPQAHSSFNPPPLVPFNNPPPPSNFNNSSPSQSPYHPINIPHPPLSFNNPTYIPSQRPLSNNDFPVTTSSTNFNENRNRIGPSGPSSAPAALDTTPPAICLEDMIKIYEACDTSIDGDMVPTD